MTARPRSDAMVLFGASGDLANKMLYPALQALVKHEHFHMPVIGVSRSDWSDQQLRERAHESVERNHAVDRVVSDLATFEAKSVPPQTTRAKLRGDFIKRAQEKRRDFTVDWVHLKLNDQAQRTVLCKDPFRSVDERVEKLIAGM